MAAIGVLVSVAPLIAAICPDELRAASRAGLLVGVAGCYGERIVYHSGWSSPLLLAVRMAWRAIRRRGGGPRSGMQSQ
jgi:hypothetical protein